MTVNDVYKPWFIIGWVIIFLMIVVSIYYISAIIFPFIFGFFIAYAVEPNVSRLHRWGIDRNIATLVMLLGFLVIFGSFLFILIPFLTLQIVGFAGEAPEYAKHIYEQLLPYIRVFAIFGSEDAGAEQANNAKYLTDILGLGLKFLEHLLTNTLAVVNLITLIIITPVVAFYLLKDWPRLSTKMQEFLSRKQVKTISNLVEEINATLGAYLRGQSLVCLIMVLFYSLGLWIIGLQYAFPVGILAGLLSFIPYVGVLVSVSVAIVLAVAQFDTWVPIVMVGGVFIIGQILEEQYLIPQLIGRHIGIHPVWVLFVLLAAGSMFGLFGLLIAMPIAAIIGVLARYVMRKYVGDLLPYTP